MAEGAQLDWPVDAADAAPVELLVCVTCRMGLAADDPAPRPGARLAEALAEDVPEGVVLRRVACLSNCSEGCSVVLRGGPHRWTYVYGRLTPEMADLVRDGAIKYAAQPDGLVPWRARSEHFRKNCIARIPPLDLPEPETADD